MLQNVTETAESRGRKCRSNDLELKMESELENENSEALVLTVDNTPGN